MLARLTADNRPAIRAIHTLQKKVSSIPRKLLLFAKHITDRFRETYLLDISPIRALATSRNGSKLPPLAVDAAQPVFLALDVITGQR